MSATLKPKGPAPDPRIAAALALYKSGRAGESAIACRRLLGREPRHLGALNLLGAIEADRGQHESAVAVLRRALEVAPSSHRTLSNMGLSLHRLGRSDEALDCFAEALRLAPGYAIAWYNQGLVQRELGRYDAALQSYDRAIQLQPAFPDALGNRGQVLQDLGRPEAALVSYDESLRLRPDHAETYGNRAVALQRLGQLENALSSLEKAVAIDSRSGPLHFHHGAVLYDLGRYEEAIVAFNQAIACPGALPQYWIRRGHALRESGAFEAALESYERAGANDAEYPDAHWNAAFARLLLGQLERGFREHEWRWRTPSLGLRPREFAQPLWLGDAPLERRTMLVHAEQGYGDTIQMARYLRALEARGATVILEVPPRLVRLFASLPGASRVIAQGDPLPPFDVHCPIMSLPLALGTRLDTIPADGRYLHPEPGLLAEWRARLGPRRGLRVGVAWSGNPFPPKRSIALASFGRLLDLPVEFVSLQRELNASDEVALRALEGGRALRHFGAQQADFADTAALIDCMDLVVSIDTAMAHLAGALAKPVWILLPFSPDWRWLLNRRDSPWYPTAELFRQPRAGDWDAVLHEVRARLLVETAARGHTA
jgi:tetratricopeptide (TPR) repeat protein